MSKARIGTLALSFLLLLVSALGAQQASLGGRVYDAGSGKGIGSLAVQLALPRAEGNRQIITYTDTEGRYKLPNLSPGKYLLTVSQGSTLLHREVVEVRGEATQDVRLQRG